MATRKSSKALTRKKRKYIPPHVREASVLALRGNAFWMQRSKHGRDKLFKSPELLWEAACEYFKWCDDNPQIRCENKVVSNGNNSGSSVELCEEPVKRAYTIEGLCLYLDCASSYFRVFKHNLLNKEVPTEDDNNFLTVLEKIHQTIYEQQFNGAAGGFFNASIIARSLGLVERIDQRNTDEPIKPPIVNVVKEIEHKLANDEQSIE